MSVLDYRKEAHEKFLQKKIKDEFETKLKDEESVSVAVELTEEEIRIAEELSLETAIYNIIDEHIELIELDTDYEHIILNLLSINTIIETHIWFINKIKEKLQDKIMNLVNILNSINKKITRNLDYVNQTSILMKSIFELLEIEIDVELMDTSNDEEFAKNLAKDD